MLSRRFLNYCIEEIDDEPTSECLYSTCWIFPLVGDLITFPFQGVYIGVRGVRRHIRRRRQRLREQRDRIEQLEEENRRLEMVRNIRNRINNLPDFQDFQNQQRIRDEVYNNAREEYENHLRSFNPYTGVERRRRPDDISVNDSSITDRMRQVISQEEHGDCSICLEHMNKYENNVGILTCSHTFHRECINHWFRQELNDVVYRNPQCPLCREPIHLPIGIITDGSQLH